MKKAVVLAVMLTMVLIAAAPVLAQEEGTIAETQEAIAAEPGAPSFPPYAVTSDGAGIIVDGDVVIDCDPVPPDYAELCARRDSLPPSQTELGDQDYAGKKKNELPITGGVSLLALGAGALIVSGGAIARRILR